MRIDLVFSSSEFESKSSTAVDRLLAHSFSIAVHSKEPLLWAPKLYNRTNPRSRVFQYQGDNEVRLFVKPRTYLVGDGPVGISGQPQGVTP